LDHKLSVVAHGNFDSYVVDKEISKNDARCKIGIGIKDKVILFFGYIRNYKGLDLALEAFDMACLERDDLRLVIAGSPHDTMIKEKYLNLINGMKFKEKLIYNFNFIKFEDVAVYFTAADVVVLPYRKIDHSGIIHLAYSFGRPVIATQVGDFAEVVVNTKSGYLVNKDDSVDLARGIIAAFSDEKWPAKAGVYAKGLSDNRFSWNVIGEETKQVYEKLL
jgi:glycosyltransferase involved in cell wall biosynthesis